MWWEVQRCCCGGGGEIIEIYSPHLSADADADDLALAWHRQNSDIFLSTARTRTTDSCPSGWDPPYCEHHCIAIRDLSFETLAVVTRHVHRARMFGKAAAVASVTAIWSESTQLSPMQPYMLASSPFCMQARFRQEPAPPPRLFFPSEPWPLNLI
jgi:hypothetical protein